MTDAVVTALLGDQSFAAGTVAGAYLFELVGADGSTIASQSVTGSETDVHESAAFPGVAAGTGYTVRATRLDGSGAPLAPAVTSAPFDVSQPSTVTFKVPNSVSVALA